METLNENEKEGCTASPVETLVVPDTLKCGRITYKLRRGDTVMDNESCLQLTTRKISKGWFKHSPVVSKKEFGRFKKMNVVSKITSSNEKFSVTEWVYQGA